jgi:signal transduction histidine kinase
VNTLSNYYGALLKSSDDLVELLKNLLNWSLMQSGRNSYNPTMFNLVAALQPDINIVRSMAERKNIAFETQLPATALVTADEDMLKTVVRNLLANAVKFTEPGGTVTLEITPNDDDGTGVARNARTVSISDTGVGMTEAQISRLFKLDSSISQSGTAGEHGTGLGLIVCKEMLEKHGAKLNLQSEKGKGSRFGFELENRN